MAYTQADIDALKSAISLGAVRVAYNDRTVQYRDLEEMRSILREMEAEVNPPDANAKPRANQAKFVTSKGF